ncbi:hypothetical protein JTE90_028504 [Oedothorax gibbosus]|uniref:C2H2-type domain-containing protein n=1 Tax=Oedothorax gibbosus TaxID=931172 RepID=A0AAV6VUT7_9ARAC|nr:hypothetical protein JTE90_028504 [Oedothorax gibbosus]
MSIPKESILYEIITSKSNDPIADENNAVDISIDVLDAHSIPVFTCNACFQNFLTKQLLQQHERTHTSAQENGNLNYGCVLCDYCFILQRDLEDHMDEHEKVYLHTCKECEKSFFYSYILQKHLLKHKQQFVCNVCRESFDDKNRLHEHEHLHLVNHLDENSILRFACELCSVMFPLKVDLETHYNDSHEGFNRFPCPMCNESYFFSFMLSRHKMTHMELKNVQCELCPTSFKTKKELNIHMKHKHLEKEFKCLECGKTFSLKRLLLRHNVSHTTLRPFPCSICGLAFKFKQNLDRHILTHTDTKYECKKCDQSFTRPSGLRNHMKLHNREPLACKECGKTYMSHTMLSKHIIQEHPEDTSARLYTCGICGKSSSFECKYCSRTFLQRPHLLAHHQFHHRGMELVFELPIQCTYCKQSCLLEAGLQKHHAKYNPSLEIKHQLNSEDTK